MLSTVWLIAGFSIVLSGVLLYSVSRAQTPERLTPATSPLLTVSDKALSPMGGRETLLVSLISLAVGTLVTLLGKHWQRSDRLAELEAAKSSSTAVIELMTCRERLAMREEKIRELKEMIHELKESLRK